MEGVHASSSTPHSRPSSVRRKSVASGHVSVVTPNITDKHAGKVMLLDDVEKIFEALDHYQVNKEGFAFKIVIYRVIITYTCTCSFTLLNMSFNVMGIMQLFIFLYFYSYSSRLLFRVLKAV